MADIRVCNDRCGCPVPCTGGDACRCATVRAPGTFVHSTCTCGEHCSCNPCTCGRASATTGVPSGRGRSACACGPGCTCTTCAA